MLLKPLVSSKSNDWCTPDVVLSLIRKFGVIVQDPCSNGNSIVGAVKNYSLPDQNGLLLDWATDGLVFVNPPYGRELKDWAKKIIWQSGKGSEIIALTPSRTGSSWCQALLRACDAYYFWPGRIKFLGAKHPAPFDIMLTYFGSQKQRFREVLNCDERGLPIRR